MKKLLIALSTLLCISTCHLAYAQQSTADKQREIVIDELMASKLFVSFPIIPFNVQKRYGFYSCDFKGEDYSHQYGVYGSNNVRFSTLLSDGEVKNFTLSSTDDYLTISDDAPFISQKACLEKAIKIKELLRTNIAFKSGYLAEPQIKNSKYDWSIEWQAYETTRMQKRSISIRIRKIDGKATFVNVRQYKWISEDRQNGLAMSYKEALNAAILFLKSRHEGSNARLQSWKIHIENNLGEYYKFQFQLPENSKPIKKYRTQTVFVSPYNGKPQLNLPKPETSYVNGDDLVYSSYNSPHWTRQGLVFTSTRFRQSFDNKKLYPKVILRDLLGNFSVIYSVSNPSVRIIFSAPWSDWILINDKGCTYAINLDNGYVKSLVDSYGAYGANILDVDLIDKNYIPITKVKPPLVATFASIGSQSRTRLCLDSLAPSFPLGSHQPLNWNDNMQPCFSPNGKDVYLFRSASEIAGKPSTSIRRMGIRAFFSSITKAKFDIIKESVPLCHIPNNVFAIQPYPEGNQLFIATDDYRIPAIIVDLKTLKQTSLTTKAILQKNVAQLSNVWNIYAGPKTGEITIYASTKNKVNQLFVCNLDGSNLRALTPAHEMPTKYYNFPSGKTGFDVSKEIALDQLRQERKRASN